jgi:dolichyl-diphosphooligosaccharide--protein glycosyltransferase
MKSSWKEKLVTLSIFFISVLVGIKLRILNPWHFVFTKWGVIFTGNDPWYYYRLIDSCIHNFPNRLWFDAFTYYPYGTFVHFGPFLVYLGTFLCKLLGASTPEAIKSVLVFVPTIAGILMFLPAYLLTREAFDRKTALIAAITTAVLPGQILYRGELGFNDHHIWEVFWMVTSLGTFLYSYNRLKNKDIKDIVKSKEILYVLPSGLALGLYLLAWAPGFINALILISYVFLVFLFERWLNVDFRALTITCITTFVIASLIYLPFAFKYPGFSTTHYSPFQLLVLLLCGVAAYLLYIFDKLSEKDLLTRIYKDPYIVSRGISIALVIIGILAGNVVFPSFVNTIKGIIGVIQPKGGMLTVAEVQPFFVRDGKFSLVSVYPNFGSTFYFAIIGYVLSGYFVYARRDVKHLLILWWGILMLVALAGQSRFAYYYGAVSAILASVTVCFLLDRLEFCKRFVEFLKELNQKKLNIRALIHSAIGVLLLGLLIYPTYSVADLQSKYAGGGIPKQWYDALVWMRDNTPGNASYDKYFYEIYRPPSMRDLLERKPYSYPFKTYGVISWWDYGHWITTIAHRLPIANPFQQGIGNKYDNVPGAAPFFTAFNESYANEIADKLNVKYVVSDVEMATGKFYAMATWAEGSLEKAGMYMLWPENYEGQTVLAPKYVYLYVNPNGTIGISEYIQLIPLNAKILGRFLAPGPLYYKTMEAKLHILDGLGLKHYRMVYESDPGEGWTALQEIVYRIVYNEYFSRNSIPVNVTPSGYVKIFEYVPGAKIVGRVNDTNITYAELFLKVKTNKGRVFTYYQRANVVNGTFEFIVPYAQDTKYPVKPITPYIVLIGNQVKEISVSDRDVESGKTITINFR